MTLYKTIIFDLDNTLINYELCEYESMKNTLRDHKIFVDDAVGMEQFWVAYPKHSYRYWIDFVSGGKIKSIRELLVSTFRDVLDRDERLHEQLADAYWEYFCHTCIFEEGAEEMLDQLKGRYQLGIITNGISDSQGKRLQAGGIDGLFEAVIISDEVGLRKPDKGIFEIALRELNAERHEVLYVGDSVEDDLVGAMNAGIDFCFYNRKEVGVPDGMSAKFVIKELGELVSILKA